MNCVRASALVAPAEDRVVPVEDRDAVITAKVVDVRVDKVVLQELAVLPAEDSQAVEKAAANALVVPSSSHSFGFKITQAGEVRFSRPVRF